MTSTAFATRPAPTPARPAVRANRRPTLAVVPRPTSRPLRPAVALGLAVVVVFGALFAAAVVHSMLVSGQARLDQVTTEARAERELLDAEQLRLAVLQSPERITAEAERIGMVPGGTDNWMSQDGSTSSSTDATPPTDQRSDPVVDQGVDSSELAAAPAASGAVTP